MSRPSLHPQTTWLFAFGAVAIGIGVGYLARGLPQKIQIAIYGAIVGSAGFASIYLTRARLRQAVLAFFVAAVACAGLYYLLVSSLMRDATLMMTDAVSGGQAHDQGVQVSGTFGRFFGVFAAAVAFLETFIGGVAGAVFGNSLREKAPSPGLAGAAR